jgi:hypothetical protein
MSSTIRIESPRGTSLTVALSLVFWALGAGSFAEASEKDLSPADREFFEREIRPALAETCSVCHSAVLAQAELRLDSREGWEAGGKSGPAIIPGDPDGSPLIRAIRQEGPELPMPLGSPKLSPRQIRAFERWVLMGAPDPRGAPTADPPSLDQTDLEWEKAYSKRSRWWSLQPVIRPPLPDVKQADWSDQAIDHFVLAKLEIDDLSPAPRADQRTLLRRLNYVLTGLPPTPDEVEAFGRDPDPRAYAQEVDRLLASSHFGERWARHWMDVVRYSDTYGYETDAIIKGSWRFRDYLIRSFNADIPFDQLVREHIAGDLLPEPRIDASTQTNESIIGPTWFQMGENRHGDSLMFNGIHQEMLDNKIDAFSKAFQATTVACARCHDHKYDAISQRDYYGLGGVFMSPRWVTHTLDTPDRNREVLEELSALKAKFRGPMADWWLEEARKIPQYLLAAQARADESSNAAQLTQTLDQVRLSAWEKVLAPTPYEEPDPADETETEKAAQPDENAPLRDPLFPWLEVHQAVKGGRNLESSWRKLAEKYARTRRESAQVNAKDFSLIADFSSGKIPEGWSVDGVGLRHGLVRNGDFTVALEGAGAIGRLLPAGLFTLSLSPRLNGAVRTPYLVVSGRPYISMEVSGGDYSAKRLIIDNSYRTERQKYLEDDHLHWIRYSTTAKAKTNRSPSAVEASEIKVYVELATKASNPNFPPRLGLGPDISGREARDARSWFGITRAFLHDKEESPADELTRFGSLFAGDSPLDVSDVATRYGQWLTASLEDWAEDRADEDDVLLINWMLENGLLPNNLLPRNMDARKSIWELVASYRAVEERLAEPQTVLSMADLDPGQDYRLNVRGVYADLGDPVPRGYVRALAGERTGSAPTGSGRMELAHLVASSENPLTARVFVNRVWHWVFGSGIVETTDDFGHLGDKPSHPELLDYLADRFVEEGWSVKRLVRTLLMTETFQQSSQTSAQAREVDPTNRLLHHYPLRRLDAESIRDSILAVSGRLDPQLFGGLIDPYRAETKGNTKKDQSYYSGPLDGRGRRSIYLRNSIMQPERFLSTFNKPNPKIPTGKRDVTNVPAQALTMLNDPFVVGQAEFWARRLIASSHESPEERLTAMFQSALGRDPQPQELARWTQAVHDFSTLYREKADKNQASENVMQSVAVWKDAAHAIFNTTEFIYVR